MSGRWIAGSVRAQLLVSERTAGADAAAAVAAAPTFADGLALVAQTPYRRGVRPDLTVQETQRAIAATALLNLRILAGWLPGEALPLLRAVAAWFELCNLEERAAYLAGASAPAPFELGSLGTAWPRAASAQTLEELRFAVAPSAWGDPDGATPTEFGLGLRFAWAHRVSREAPEAQHWAAGAAALLLARELFLQGTPVELLRLPRLDVLGSRWPSAGTYADLVGALPAVASWVLAGSKSPDDLWRAEGRWWQAVALGGRALLSGSTAGRRKVVGAAAVLGADAHRLTAAIGATARRGLPGAEEAFHAAA
ncbi:MAG: hypothetical protein ACXVZL_05995 [Gaiellaceae bacterium]